LRETRNGLAGRRGILCFSADWKDPVIWAHYSDKHRGLCLGFDIPDEKCKRIEYATKRLKLPAKPNLVDAEVLLFTKYINWAYEQEIRVWAALNTEENGLYFSYSGNKLQLVRVIAGASCSLSEREIMGALEPQAGVSVIKARAGFKEFEIVKDKRGFPKARGDVLGALPLVS